MENVGTFKLTLLALRGDRLQAYGAAQAASLDDVGHPLTSSEQCPPAPPVLSRKQVLVQEFCMYGYLYMLEPTKVGGSAVLK